MGWLEGFTKGHKIDETIWMECKACNKHILREEWEKGYHVCPKCTHHARIDSRYRLEITVDPDTFEEMDASIHPADPLSFHDKKGSYADKAEAAREKSGLNESIVTGRAKIMEHPVVVGVMDFRFLGGSLSSGTGEKIVRAAHVALDERKPLILFSASGGARMHEGILSLMQMAKTCGAIAQLDEENISYISVLTDPTTGGVSASYAMVGDINIAEPGALIGFAGKRVIKETLKQKLPEDFQTSEYYRDHGFLDRVVHRKDMRTTLGDILSFYNR
ncbi:acetyl-CoA carboxylase, carboxyltransferase subunit beta [Chitinivibrio alkaliphilus]|uniref:Acetyl-coenzyme A carboxylase carboxyl transferase subunit beta n=1 Tax=Chitinivibrio alkaliphilus ACht1 TaxID=1313304 RepID=U7D9S1_9BACT|nr:acetyl-CoA carboxylase, carboxyltransferase subunit beta [Chitinivibrio alkaliphilus]ERP31170.1 acetyl-CoA carboxylase, carboxyl transferase, beta subunit [Chitinivibrio alkaliphilus ACht1]